MKPIFIGIAGGTGAGKSTLCTSLMNKYPDRVGLIQLDDYFKPNSEVPVVAGIESWDNPESIFLDKLKKDLNNLSLGRKTVINTKNEILNPNFKNTHQRIPVEFEPKPVMLVEGYLVLFDSEIRNFLSTSIWLEAPHDIRWKRRTHFKNSEYETKVLLPMYKKYAEPTKKFAEHIIDVSELAPKEMQKKFEFIINKTVPGKL